MIDTGIKFFGLKIYLDSTNEPEVDKAAKSVFKDHYLRTAPLTIATRPDCQIMLEWGRRNKLPTKQISEQMGLFEQIPKKPLDKPKKTSVK